MKNLIRFEYVQVEGKSGTTSRRKVAQRNQLRYAELILFEK